MHRAVLPGVLSSVASTAVLALCGKREAGSMFAGVNAISHWLWGDRAMRRDGPSLQHTVVGYLIHHASAMFWATLFERSCAKVLDKQDPVATAATAAAATAVACFTDYQLTPPRLRPGFEERLSRSSLALVYAAFGIGLAAGAIMSRRDQAR
ncbi:MAG TPA: hypothetical protein VGF27_04250 [Pseudoduganella sp.]